ncbi:MAG: hypothetical protein ACYSWZ_11955, partial [Planctomycetota bacterium]
MNNNHSSIILTCPEQYRRNHLYGLYSFAFSLTSYGISSTKEQVRKNKLFLQNKAKFRKVKFDVNRVLTKDYDQLDTWSIRTTKPIKANLSQSKPIKANLSCRSLWRSRKQTQTKPNTNPTCRGVASGEAGSKLDFSDLPKNILKKRIFYLTYIHRAAMYRLLIFYLEIQKWL